MSSTELSGTTPEYMQLPRLRFKLTMPEHRNDEALRSTFMDIVERNHMHRYYKETCQVLGWEMDENLYEAMASANQAAWLELESPAGDSKAIDHGENWRSKLEFACFIGDFLRANEISTSVLEDPKTLSSVKSEAAFALFRIAYFTNSVPGMAKMTSRIGALLESNCGTGSEWCCRNKFKVYEAVYCLATRNFQRGADLLLDCIPTFESYELLTFKDMVEYTVIAGMISLPRSELHRRFNDNALLQQALNTECPGYKEYLNSLLDCRYREFFEQLAWVEGRMKLDPLLHLHYHYYVREMRIRAYTQLLQAYRSLSLTRMAMEFGVTEEYIEQEVARFIANGRLSCKIDKVAGCIITVSAVGCDRGRAPDTICDRGSIYRTTIKRGDALLNRLKKLGQLVEF